MNIEQSIIPLFGKTAKILDLYIEDRLADEGIPLSKLQFIFLMIISKNNGQPQSNLAELTGKCKTTFTRNITTLERKNLVLRDASPVDKRIKLVYIKPIGLEYIQRSRPIIQSIIEEIEEDITTEEKEAFKKTLNKIRQKLIKVRNQSNTIFQKEI